MFTCKAHWVALPRVIRRAIWREYRKGQEVDKRPSARYLAVQTAARAFLAFKKHDEAAALMSAELLVAANLHRSVAVRSGLGDPFQWLPLFAKMPVLSTDSILTMQRAAGDEQLKLPL